MDSCGLSCFPGLRLRALTKLALFRYLGFLQEAHQHYEVSVDHVLHKNFPTLLSLLRPSFLRYLIALHPFESVYYRASRYFRTERLQRVFTFSSMYMGVSD
jgi:phytoene desaturase (3,4-didehydrolycopene-forming)